MTDLNRRTALFGGLALFAVASPSAAFAQRATANRRTTTRPVYVSDVTVAQGEYISVTHETPIDRDRSIYTNRTLTNDGELYVNIEVVGKDGSFEQRQNRILKKDGTLIIDNVKQGVVSDRNMFREDMYMIGEGIDNAFLQRNNERVRIGTARHDVRAFTQILSDAFIKSYFLREVIDETIQMANIYDARGRKSEHFAIKGRVEGQFNASRQQFNDNFGQASMARNLARDQNKLCEMAERGDISPQTMRDYGHVIKNCP